MALVVEDGTGKTDADSYLSVADADTYHAAHSGSTDWSGASEADKEKGLRLATQYLDAKYNGRWRGYKNDSTQALAWPRGWGVDDEDYAIDDASVPWQLENATAELALKVVEGDTLLVDVSKPAAISSKSIKAGPIAKSVTYLGGLTAQKKYSMVDMLLVPLIESTTKLERG